MKESALRSFMKSIIWRIFATINGFLVAFFFVGNVSKSASIAIVANITGLIFYYIHERVWNKINWQRENNA